MNCTICGLPTGNIVGSVLPQCKCGWQAPQPPKAQRQPLTDEQISTIVREAARGSAIKRDGSTSQRIARAIEAAHGIKENT
jgi:hypothetical protein